MILLLIPVLVFLFVVRAHWVVCQSDQHALKAMWYCWRTQQPRDVLVELGAVWPGRYTLLEVWRWDWRRYVVHQDRYDDMERFIATELTRTDLTADWFSAAPPSPPSNPSDNEPTL